MRERRETRPGEGTGTRTDDLQVLTACEHTGALAEAGYDRRPTLGGQHAFRRSQERSESRDSRTVAVERGNELDGYALEACRSGHRRQPIRCVGQVPRGIDVALFRAGASPLDGKPHALREKVADRHQRIRAVAGHDDEQPSCSQDSAPLGKRELGLPQVLDDEVGIDQIERVVGEGQWTAEVARHELVEERVLASGSLVVVDSDQTIDSVSVVPETRRTPATRIQHDRPPNQRLLEDAGFGARVIDLQPGGTSRPVSHPAWRMSTVHDQSRLPTQAVCGRRTSPVGIVHYTGSRHALRGRFLMCENHGRGMFALRIDPSHPGRLLDMTPIVSECTLDIIEMPDGSIVFSDADAIYRLVPA